MPSPCHVTQGPHKHKNLPPFSSSHRVSNWTAEEWEEYPAPKLPFKERFYHGTVLPALRGGGGRKKAHWAFVSGKECEEARVGLLCYRPVAPLPISLPALTISGEAALTAAAAHLPSRH